MMLNAENIALSPNILVIPITPNPRLMVIREFIY